MHSDYEINQMWNSESIFINTKSSYIELDKFQLSKQGMNEKGYYILHVINCNLVIKNQFKAVLCS